MLRSNRFHVVYRYQSRPNGSWAYTTRTGDVSMWSGPRGRSETAVASWLRTYHGGATILIDELEWDDDDSD